MKYLFLDMDGVLVDYIGPNNRIGIKDFTQEGLFINQKPCWTIINAIEKLFPHNKYEYHILTASPNHHSDIEKIKWLDRYYHIDDSKIHIVRFPGEDKAKFISDFCNENNIKLSDCSFIDDTHKHLLDCEKIGIDAIHPCHLLCLYERL